jgi:type I restriction enzyme S subunit
VEEEKTHGIIGLVHVTKPELGRVLVPVAPDEEQGAIAEYLEQTTADIGIAITRTNREIDLLIEYRTRLTADVVTGKLDVREAAAELPEVDPLAADDEPDILDAGSEPDLDEVDAIPEEGEA